MPKARKYKVDEWVWYDPLRDRTTQILSQFRTKAVILSICEPSDFFDYRIYIEESARFKTVRESDLVSMEKI